MAKSYYDILGLPEDASEAEIRRAYRRVVRLFHPDLNPDNVKAAKRSRELNAALEVLTDAKKRAKYDAKLRRNRPASAQAAKPAAEARQAQDKQAQDKQAQDKQAQDKKAQDKTAQDKTAQAARPTPSPPPQRPSREDHRPASGKAAAASDPSSSAAPEREPQASRHSGPLPEFEPAADEPFVEPPAADDDGYAIEHGDPHTNPFGSPYRPHGSGGGGGYRPPRSRSAANHSMWFGFGLGASAVLVVLVLIALVMVAAWGWNEIRPALTNAANLVATNTEPPQGETDSEGQANVREANTLETKRDRDSQSWVPRALLPPAPTASRSRIRSRVDLLKTIPPPDGKREIDFVTVDGAITSRPSGLQLLQFASPKPVMEYEIAAQVQRLEGTGPLVLGFAIMGNRNAITLDGYAQLGYLSGIDNVRRQRLDQPGNPMAIRGQQLPLGKAVNIVIAVRVRDRSVEIAVDGRLIGQFQLRPGEALLEGEIADAVSEYFFLATQDAAFRIDRLEMRRIDPAWGR